MKRHRHDLEHDISIESLSFTEVQMSGTEDDAKRITTLLSVEARICPEPMNLCLRIQQWALLSFTKRDITLFKIEFVMIRDHMHVRSWKIRPLIDSQLKPGRTESEDRVCPKVLKCRYCNTDFQIETKQLRNEGLALVITTWLDLGPGLTPMDIKWRVHRASPKIPDIGVLDMPGDVRLRFESEPGLSQDSLSCQNASYLIANRFLRVMDHWENCTWVLQAGKRLPFFYIPSKATFLVSNVSSKPITCIVEHVVDLLDIPATFTPLGQPLLHAARPINFWYFEPAVSTSEEVVVEIRDRQLGNNTPL